MQFISKHKWLIAGILAGALAGFLYWNFVGCASGTCSITSKPVNSTLYRFYEGGLLFTAFKKEKKKDTDSNES